MKMIIGNVVKGQGMGKKIGFPTINIPYNGKLRGVFVGKVCVDEKWHVAAINIGGRPTVDDKILCEAFLLNFDSDVVHGTEVKFKPGKKIRDIKKFQNIADLKKQIARDVEFVKSWYNSIKKN